MDQARTSAAEGLVAVADHQTAGRGRRGRTWDAPVGTALLCSVLLRGRERAPAAVAVAAATACGVATGIRVGLKWPNDLVVDDAKLGGILAQAEGDGVVVGVGINLSWAPPGAARLGDAVDRDDLLALFLAELDRRLADWSTVASAYRRACTTVGRPVSVELPDETFTGRAADVTDEGHLLVDVGTCLRTVTTADVVHLRQNSYW